jgi:hypothetical protein
VGQFGLRATSRQREIPRPAGENTGLRDDALVKKIQIDPLPGEPISSNLRRIAL